MVYYGKLNERQVEILRRIVAGDDPVTSADSALRLTVYALRSRGLVLTNKTGKGRWEAVASEQGTATARTGRMPTKPRKTKGARLGQTSKASDTEVMPDELVARVQAADGELRLRGLSDAERAMWRRAIHAVLNGEAVPSGKRLRYKGRDHGDLILRLVDDIPQNEPRSPELDPIAIPERLFKPHPIVREFRDRPSSMSISKDHRQRALLILEAIAREAERRNFAVVAGDNDPPRRPQHRPPQGSTARGITFTLRYLNHENETFRVQLVELSTRVPHEPTATELREKERYTWTRIPDHDYVPNGQLELRLGDRYSIQKFGDRQRWKLESRLPHFFASIEEELQKSRNRAADEEQRRQEQQRLWEAAMTTAKIDLVESHRAKELKRQIEARALAQQIRDYCDELALSAAPDEEWITWARAHADRIDPIIGKMAHMPTDPEPTDEALKPFLHGWSPRRPERNVLPRMQLPSRSF